MCGSEICRGRGNECYWGDAPNGAMQIPRYTSFEKLKRAKTLSELLGVARKKLHE